MSLERNRKFVGQHFWARRSCWLNRVAHLLASNFPQPACHSRRLPKRPLASSSDRLARKFASIQRVCCVDRLRPHPETCRKTVRPLTTAFSQFRTCADTSIRGIAFNPTRQAAPSLPSDRWCRSPRRTIHRLGRAVCVPHWSCPESATGGQG